MLQAEAEFFAVQSHAVDDTATRNEAGSDDDRILAETGLFCVKPGH